MNYENEINELNKRVYSLNKSMMESVDQVLELTKLMGVFGEEFIKFQEITIMHELTGTKCKEMP